MQTMDRLPHTGILELYFNDREVTPAKCAVRDSLYKEESRGCSQMLIPNQPTLSNRTPLSIDTHRTDITIRTLRRP